ncbi:MAG: hypothetical protein ABIT38_07940, partial [Gemmatimonadaceae bacterium]
MPRDDVFRQWRVRHSAGAAARLAFQFASASRPSHAADGDPRKDPAHIRFLDLDSGRDSVMWAGFFKR